MIVSSTIPFDRGVVAVGGEARDGGEADPVAGVHGGVAESGQ